MKNRKKIKGEVATAIVIVIAAGSLLLGLMAPKLNPFQSIFSKSVANKKASFTTQKETVTPIILESKDGKQIAVGKKVELFYNTGIEDSTPKLSFGEKIGNFFANLTGISLIFILISLLFFGGAPIVFFYRKFLIVKQTLKRTVQSIREIDDETYKKLKPKLESNHDQRDKKVIDEIKKELN